jgi:hypothetical protein
VLGLRLRPLAAFLLAALFTACGSQPGISASVGKQSIPMALSSASRVTAWGAGEIGDAFPREIPLSTVRTSAGATLQFEAGQGASEIRAWIYDKDRPSPTGGPNEEFTAQGRTGAYALRSLVAGRTYDILVNVKWSGFLVHGEETHAFRLRIESSE